MKPEWALDIRDQCVNASVAFFFKQWGGRTPKPRALARRQGMDPVPTDAGRFGGRKAIAESRVTEDTVQVR